MIHMRSILGMSGAMALAVAMVLTSVSGAEQPPRPPLSPRPRQTQQPSQQPSVFRSATNLVTVDAYPRKDGRIVDNLTRTDFDVFEDGVLQKVDQFEFVRVQPVPETER